jgi:hypothetical protein
MVGLEARIGGSRGVAKFGLRAKEKKTSQYTKYLREIYGVHAGSCKRCNEATLGRGWVPGWGEKTLGMLDWIIYRCEWIYKNGEPRCNQVAQEEGG